jgi:hypothetical protein
VLTDCAGLLTAWAGAEITLAKVPRKRSGMITCDFRGRLTLGFPLKYLHQLGRAEVGRAAQPFASVE